MIFLESKYILLKNFLRNSDFTNLNSAIITNSVKDRAYDYFASLQIKYSNTAKKNQVVITKMILLYFSLSM